MKHIFALFALVFSTWVAAASLDKMVVFGDSLSDNGNLFEFMKRQLPLSPPYFDGRFTDGPIWVERLLASYYPNDSANHLLDYAFGGAGVLENTDDDDGLFTLDREIDSYLLSHQGMADEHSLFVVWIGSNNYLALPEDTDASLHDVNLGIQHGLERLADKGAKHILVVNLPDLGRIPAARDFEAVELLSHLAKTHNLMLQNTVKELQTRYPSVQWLSFDVDGMFGDVMNYPEHYGFTNVTDTCYEEMLDDQPSSASILKMVSKVQLKSAKKNACTGYLFFDPVHPSAPAHQLMAERTRLLLDEAGVAFE